MSDSSMGTRRFLYDGDDLVAEYNSSGTLLRRYVHGLGAGDDPQVWFEGSGVTDAARRYLYSDERGSVTAVTDKDGNVVHVNSYDEYGIPDAANIGAFGYTGQVWLPELGMNYYKARMYSPTLGRFMQTDPIGYGDGMNMYAYVHGDPVNGVDPSGLACVTIINDDGSGVAPPCNGEDGNFSPGGGFGNGGVYVPPSFPTGLPPLETMCEDPQSWMSAVPRLLYVCGMAGTPSQSAPDEVPQKGPSARRIACNLGDLSAALGDATTDAGGYAAVAGGIGGAALGAEAGGVGAIPGAIAGSAPGLAMMGVGGAASAFGNAAKDLAGGNYVEGAVRFTVNFAGGKVLTRIAKGSGIGSYLSSDVRGFIDDIYTTGTEALLGYAISPDSPVSCPSVK